MNTSNYENSEIKKKLDKNIAHFGITKIIKILLCIDEIRNKACCLTYDLKDDINKYGEEIVIKIDKNRNKLENFYKLESEVHSIINSNKFELESLIEFLSNLMNIK